MAVGDLDNNGKDDLILSFPGYGIWSWRNNTNWQQLHPFDALKLAVGDIDGGGVDDLIVDFATYGLWALLQQRHMEPAPSLQCDRADGRRPR